MTDPDTIITAMAQQREQERKRALNRYMLGKACEARAHEICALLREVYWDLRSDEMAAEVKQLLKEIDDATQ